MECSGGRFAIGPLLGSDEVAERLGASVRMVRKLTQERRLPYVKVGRLVRFKPSDVEAFIEANTVDPLP